MPPVGSSSGAQFHTSVCGYSRNSWAAWVCICGSVTRSLATVSLEHSLFSTFVRVKNAPTDDVSVSKKISGGYTLYRKGDHLPNSPQAMYKRRGCWDLCTLIDGTTKCHMCDSFVGVSTWDSQFCRTARHCILKNDKRPSWYVIWYEYLIYNNSPVNQSLQNIPL